MPIDSASSAGIACRLEQVGDANDRDTRQRAALTT
jgi:hypothetical protein